MLIPSVIGAMLTEEGGGGAGVPCNEERYQRTSKCFPFPEAHLPVLQIAIPIDRATVSHLLTGMPPPPPPEMGPYLCLCHVVAVSDRPQQWYILMKLKRLLLCQTPLGWCSGTCLVVVVPYRRWLYETSSVGNVTMCRWQRKVGSSSSFDSSVGGWHGSRKEEHTMNRRQIIIIIIIHELAEV